ncbi:pyridoxal phosphate-dependent aminotransferase [Actinomadura fulvescens]
MSPHLTRGRSAGLTESRHLVLKRLMASRARTRGREFLDAGTDSTYPFFDGYGPTESALDAMTASAAAARNYPSSFGLLELREAMAGLLARQFGVEVDHRTELMITNGASQAFDALSRSYAGEYVLLPELALSTVESISVGNGAAPVRVPLGPDHRLDPAALEETIDRLGEHRLRFLYLNSPANPTGVVYGRGELSRIVQIARAHRVLVIHDHDSWFTTHQGHRSVSILEIPGAQEIAVAVLSLSKELGLPGLRVGAVAGCAEVVNTLRVHNSLFSVMIPEFCQRAASEALRRFRPDAARERLQKEIGSSLRVALQGLRELGWPEQAVLPPSAGYKFLFRPPPSFSFTGDPSGVELFDFLLARDASVKLSTSRSFNHEDQGWMRIILMQTEQRMKELFSRLHEIGVSYTMPMPAGLVDDYRTVMSGHDLSNL